MSKRVYLKIYFEPINLENTPVSIRIQLSLVTVKSLQTRLQHAYNKDDVRRIAVLINLFVCHVLMEVLHECWG
jgi:hypothetical protein